MNIHEYQAKAVLRKYGVPVSYGKVAFIMFTDRQFGMMEVFYATKKTDTPRGPQQLEMF